MFWKTYQNAVFLALLMTIPALMGAGEGIGRIEGQDEGTVPEDLIDGLDLSSLRRGYFTENIGQIQNDDIRYYIPLGSLNVGFAEDGIYYDLRSREGNGHLYKMEFVGPNRCSPQGELLIDNSINYIRPEGEYTGIRSYSRVRYCDIWDGIDLIFYFYDGGLKYDFIVGPGADPEEISMECFGADLRLDSGRLVIGTSLTDVEEDVPLSFDGCGNIVGTEWSLSGSRVGFVVEEYDDTRPLTIDPKLLFSTYIGGSAWEVAMDITIGPDGNPYICGYTNDANFPTTVGAYDRTYGGSNKWDVIVTKVNKTGRNLLYSTFVGGSGNVEDRGYGIAIDSNGSAVVAGGSASFDTNRFPTTVGAYSTTYTGNGEVILFKLNPTGSSLIFSTYVGGFQGDVAFDVALDSNENPVIIGATSNVPEAGKDFYPVTSGAYDTSFNGMQDAFVSKFDNTGSDLLYSTYLGGGSVDEACAMMMDSNDRIYITGYTESSGFPKTTTATHRGSEDVFLTIMQKDLSGIVASTLIGGTASDRGYGIARDKNGNLYVTGKTYSTNYPRGSGFGGSFGGYYYDGFLTVFDTSLNWIRSSYIGGNGYDCGNSVSVDDFGRAIVTGYTSSNDYPTTEGCLQPKIGGETDVFLLRVSPAGNTLDYLTYIGGSGYDDGSGASSQGWSTKHAFDSNTTIFIAGSTTSTNFPVTSGAYAGSNAGNDDVYVLRTYPGSYEPRNVVVEKGYLYFNVSWSMPDVKLFRHFTLTNYSIYIGFNASSTPFFKMFGNTTWFNYTVPTFVDRTYFFGVTATWTVLGESMKAFNSEPLYPKLPPIISNPRSESRFFTVNLTWDRLPGIVHRMFNVTYQVFRGETPDDLTLYKRVGANDWCLDTMPSMTPVKHYYAISYEIPQIGQREPWSVVIDDTPKVPPEVPGRRISSYPFMIELSWDLYGEEVTDELNVSYWIYRAPNKGALEKIAETNGSVYEDQILEFDQMRFDYMVRPYFDGFTLGNVSSRLSASQIVLESRPSDVSMDVSEDGIRLSWSGPEGQITDLYPLESYNIYRSIDGEDLELYVYNVTGTTYHDTNVSTYERHNYSYSIDAVYSVLGEGNLSEPSWGTNLIVPSTPRNMKGQFGNGFIDIEWQAPFDDGGSGLVKYLIMRNDEGTDDYVTIAELSTDQFHYNDTDIVMGAAYKYLVKAVNGVGMSLNDLPISITPVWVPDKPMELNISYGNLWILLRWKEPQNDGGREINYYNVYRRTEGEDWDDAGVGYPWDLSFNDTDVEIGVLYEYKITAENEIGESPDSVTVMIVPLFPPDTVAELVLEYIDGKVHIAWEVPGSDGGSPVTELRLFRDGVLLIALGPQETYHLDGTVEEGRTYEYSMVVVNAIGPSKPSRSFAIDVPSSIPQVNGVGSSIGDGKVTISWDIPDEGAESGFKIYRIKDNGTPELIGQVDGNTDTFSDTTLKGPGRYTYYVKVSDDEDTSIPTSTTTVDIPSSFFYDGGDDDDDGPSPVVPIVAAFLVLFVVCIIIGTVLFLVLAKRKGASTKAPADKDIAPPIVEARPAVGQPAGTEPVEKVVTGPPVQQEAKPVSKAVAAPSVQPEVKPTVKVAAAPSVQTVAKPPVTSEVKTVGPQDPYVMAERMRTFAKEKGLDLRLFEMQYNTALNFRKMNNETFGKMSMTNYNRSIENLMRSKGIEPPK